VTIGRGGGNVAANTAVGYQAGNAVNTNNVAYGNTYVGYQAGYSNTGGYNHVYIGYRAGYSGTNSDDNIAVGWRALYTNNAYSNIAIGSESLFNNTSLQNIVVGHSGGKGLANAQHNVLIGNLIMSSGSTVTGGNNTIVGSNAYPNGIGGNNVFFGYRTAYSAKDLSSTTAFGFQTLYNITTGLENLAFGPYAGYSLTGSNYVTLIGAYTNYLGTTGTGSVFVGYNSGYNNNGNYNVGVGYNSSFKNNTGGYNVFLGYKAGYENTTGSYNVYLGGFDGTGYATSSNNVFISDGAGNIYIRIPSTGNVLIGTTTDGGYKLYVNGNVATVDRQYNTFNGITIYTGLSGSTNTAIGNPSGNQFPLQNVQSGGNDNVAIGNATLQLLTTATRCVAVGNSAGRGITDGAGYGYDVAIGYEAMSLSNPGFSVAIGTQALYSGVTGNNIVAVGNSAGKDAAIGAQSTLLGANSGLKAAGTYNTLIGYSAGSQLTTAAKNTYLGCFNGTGFETSSNNIFLSDGDGNVRIRIPSTGNVLIGQTTDYGYKLDVSGTTILRSTLTYTGATSASTSYVLYFNNTTGLVTYAAAPSGSGTITGAGTTNYLPLWTGSTALGNSVIFNTGTTVGINISTPGYPLHVSGATSSTSIYATNDIVAFSDQSVKTEVQVIENAIEKIKGIRGVTFVRSDMEDKTRRAGVIAQEVEKVLPEVISKNQDGTLAVAYGNLVSLLIEGIKELSEEITELKKKIN
jgi:hypothetical protein